MKVYATCKFKRCPIEVARAIVRGDYKELEWGVIEDLTVVRSKSGRGIYGVIYVSLGSNYSKTASRQHRALNAL